MQQVLAVPKHLLHLCTFCTKLFCFSIIMILNIKYRLRFVSKRGTFILYIETQANASEFSGYFGMTLVTWFILKP